MTSLLIPLRKVSLPIKAFEWRRCARDKERSAACLLVLQYNPEQNGSALPYPVTLRHIRTGTAGIGSHDCNAGFRKEYREEDWFVIRLNIPPRGDPIENLTDCNDFQTQPPSLCSVATKYSTNTQSIHARRRVQHFKHYVSLRT